MEAYLCRKNDGHLIRIVGPAFEQVCGWAARGVPLAVVHHGIDRYFERYYAKGPRRRPVRVEFCEADVLDAFDEWRRAVGVTAAANEAGEAGGAGGAGGPGRKDSLPAHLERVVARLTTLRAGEDRRLEAVLDETVRELDAARASARGLRGAAREAFIARLRDLDRRLLDVARSTCSSDLLDRLTTEARAELAPFRERLPADAYERSVQASLDRLLRERARLPVVAFD